MSQTLFGIDGIRGTAGRYPITPEFVMRLAQSAGRHFSITGERSCVLVGKDTRASGYMLESALVAGFTSIGMDVSLAGTIPSAAVGMLTKSLRANFGVMISASRNSYHDNGLKFFGPDGFKIAGEDELAIERDLKRSLGFNPNRIGSARRIEGALQRYMAVVKQSIPPAMRLSGLKIVIDAANGAAYRTAPEILWELGAEIVEIGTKPNGTNINDRCGTTDISACRQAVLDSGADIGIALDGDADRVGLVDEKGNIVDGDQLLALIAERAISNRSLRNAALVATIMSNAGLDQHLSERNVSLVRTDVGDRYVAAKMREIGCNIGGEQSGHIILSDFSTTGDGLIAALHALTAMVNSGRPASETLTRFTPLPQVRRDIGYVPGAIPLQAPEVCDAISEVKHSLGQSGRIVVRASSTQPVIRIMLEGDDLPRMQELSDQLCHTIRQSSGDPIGDDPWAAEIEACSLPPRTATSWSATHRGSY